MRQRIEEYGPFILGVSLALLFIIAGIGKLINPPVVVGMLSSLGFPLSFFLAWILILSEIIFGLGLLIG